MAQAPGADPPATPGCSNSPANWRDSDSDDCAFYAEGSNCADYGNDFAGIDGKTANEACCICGGGLDPNNVPAPTPAPAPAPVDDDDDDICFSGHSEVQVEGKGIVRMDALKIGNAVLTADGSYSKVYSFGHKALSSKTMYLQVFAGSMEKGHPLEISAEHLIYIHDTAKKAWVLVPAEDLRVGDTLLAKDGIPSKVLSIRKVERQGAYSPLIESGNLLVNGVLASSYVSRCWLKDHVSGNTLHTFQHGATLPVRLFCSMVDCKMETYNETTGFSAWVQFWFDIEQWILTLPKFLQVTFLLLLVVPVTLIALLGKFLVMPGYALLAHAATAAVGYLVLKCQYKKGTVSGKDDTEKGGKAGVKE